MMQIIIVRVEDEIVEKKLNISNSRYLNYLDFLKPSRSFSILRPRKTQPINHAKPQPVTHTNNSGKPNTGTASFM